MVQENELRIGNIVSDIIGLEKHLVVYKIEYGIITCGDNNFSYPYLIEQLKPLELSVEAIENIGFKWNKSTRPGWYLSAGNKWNMRVWQDDEHDFLWSINDFNSISLMSVHQLQNLYFALTGEELNVQFSELKVE